MTRAGILAVAAVLAAWTFATPVSAYLDPGTGNTLLQGLIGSVAVVTGLAGYYWHRLRALVSFRKSEVQQPRSTDHADRSTDHAARSTDHADR